MTRGLSPVVLQLTWLEQEETKRRDKCGALGG